MKKKENVWSEYEGVRDKKKQEKEKRGGGGGGGGQRRRVEADSENDFEKNRKERRKIGTN